MIQINYRCDFWGKKYANSLLPFLCNFHLKNHKNFGKTHLESTHINITKLRYKSHLFKKMWWCQITYTSQY